VYVTTVDPNASLQIMRTIYQGDYRAADRFVTDLRRVRPDDIRRAARLYIRNFSFAYVGDPSRLDRSYLDRF
jgi:hypothetical protein